jgi:glutamine cyclotransferase
MTKLKLILFVLVVVLFSCNKKSSHTEETSSVSSVPSVNYGVIGTHAHDINSFMEGLLVHEGKLFESTGSPQEFPQAASVAGIVDLSTGKIDKKVELDRNKYFGEGIVIFGDKLYQLTYVTKKGFVYDLKNYQKIDEFTIPSKEGWGFTTDGKTLIMSDGTATLTYLDPVTYHVIKTLQVKDDKGEVSQLNELEFIKGYLYANVYGTNTIVKIDPSTGSVVGKLDMVSLARDAKAKNNAALEMNGIAFDSVKQTVYVTGKFWPSIYEIKFKY